MVHSAFRALFPLSLFLLILAPSLRAQPSVSATLQDALQVDQDSDTRAEAGDTIRYRAVLSNTGSTTATLLRLLMTLDPNAPLVAGSLKSTPLAIDDLYTVSEDGSLNVAAPGVLANDFDLPLPLALTLTNANPGGSAGSFNPSPAGGLIYAPAAAHQALDDGEVTTETLTYDARDADLQTNGGAVRVVVQGANDAPVAAPQTLSTDEDTNLPILMAGSDVDVENLTISIVTSPAASAGSLGGTTPFPPVSGTVLFMPDSNELDDGETEDGSFTFKANDGTVDSPPATISLTVNGANDAPVADGQTIVKSEDDAPFGVTLTASDADVENQTLSIVSSPNAAVGGLSGLTQVPPASATATYTLAAGNQGLDDGESANGSFTFKANDGTVDSADATVAVTVNGANDAPAANPPSAFVKTEDDGSFVITLAGSDADVENLTISIVDSPAAGAGSLSAPFNVTSTSVDVTYTPNNASMQSMNVGNTRDGSFTFKVNDGTVDSATATVTVTFNGANDLPVIAAALSYDTAGNTLLINDASQSSTPSIFVDSASRNLLTGVTDVDGPGPLTVTGFSNADPGSAPAVVSGTAGTFTYLPAAGSTAADALDYAVSDGIGASTFGLTITPKGMIWYVDNQAAGGGTGRSNSRFNTLAAAEAASAAGDTIYVFQGDGSTTGQNAGFTMKANQRLIGSGVALTLQTGTAINGGANPLTLLAAGTRPSIGNASAGGNGVTILNVSGVEVRGLDIAGNTNAIDVTTTAANGGGATIHNNAISAAGSEGVDINRGGSGTLTIDFQNNTISSTGNGFDAANTAASGAFNVTFSNNTGITSGATGVSINGAGGTTVATILGFSNNTVHGNTAGSGILVTSATFDSVPGGAIDQVAGGSTVIGASGNGAGASGMVLTNVQGNLLFTDLDIFADGGAGLSASGTGGGLTLGVGAGVGVVEAAGGPAVGVTNATIDLQLTSIRSSNSTTAGVSLTTCPGTFSAGNTSSITNATGTCFDISGANASVTYNGTITDTTGRLVSIASCTGGTKSFTGAITDSAGGSGTGISLTGNNASTTMSFSGGVTLSTGGNPAFTATGGGVLSVTGGPNTLAATTATALNVNGVTIGASGLTFRSINAGTGASGPVNGIVLNNTGSSGGLTVSGTGGAGTGGTIQRCTGDGISLTSCSAVSLSSMNVTSNQGNGIRGSSVTNLTLSGLSIGNNADDGALDEAGIHLTNLFGTCAFSNTTVFGSIEDNARIINSSGTLNGLTITGCVFRDTSTVSPGNNGLLIQADNAASMTVDISTTNFIRNRANGLQVITNNQGIVDLDLGTGVAGSGGTIEDNNIGANYAHNSTGSMTADVQRASIVAVSNTAGASPVNLNLGTGATSGAGFQGHVHTNTISNLDSLTGPGIRVTGNGSGGVMTYNLQANTISLLRNRGIEIIARDGSNTMHANLNQNTVNLTNALAADGVHIAAGAVSTDTVTINLDVRNNGFTTVAGNNGIEVRQRFAGTTFRLEGYGGGATDMTAVQNHITSTLVNTSNPAAFANFADGGFINIGNVNFPAGP